MGYIYYLFTQNQSWKQIYLRPMGTVRHVGGFVVGASLVNCLYSYFFEPYCDVNSYLYKTGEAERQQRLMELRKELRMKRR